MRKNVAVKFVFIAAIIIGLGLIVRAQLLHMFSFSFVDEYNYPVSADFMLKGKQLHKEVFFNHQVLAAYMSYMIQLIAQPATLYALIATHRVFVIVFSYLLGALLVWRFRFKGVVVFFIFEALNL